MKGKSTSKLFDYSDKHEAKIEVSLKNLWEPQIYRYRLQISKRRILAKMKSKLITYYKIIFIC